MFKELFQGIVVDFLKEHFNKLILLLPSGLTVYLQNNYWMVLFIFVLSLAIYFLIIIRQYELAGITSVYKPNYITTVKALEKTESSFCFLGVSAKSTADNKEVEKQFLRLQNHSGYEIKFLLMSPSATDNIKARAKDENADYKAWILHMKSSLLSLQKIAESHNLNIQIRLYDEYPLWRMIVIDKKRVFLNYALPNIKINSSPLIKMTNKDNALCNTFIRRFDLLWDDQSTVALENWLKVNKLE
jgi:hypothetical protein